MRCRAQSRRLRGSSRSVRSRARCDALAHPCVVNVRRFVHSQAAASATAAPDAASDPLAPAAQALEDQEEACFRVRANPLVGTVAYLPDLPTLRTVARVTARQGGAESQWADLPDGAAAWRHSRPQHASPRLVAAHHSAAPYLPPADRSLAHAGYRARPRAVRHDAASAGRACAGGAERQVRARWHRPRSGVCTARKARRPCIAPSQPARLRDDGCRACVNGAHAVCARIRPRATTPGLTLSPAAPVSERVHSALALATHGGGELSGVAIPQDRALLRRRSAAVPLSAPLRSFAWVRDLVSRDHD